MAGDNVYVSVNDPDVYPSQIAFMNVQFIFDYESGDLFSCEEALDALVAIADFAVPEAVPEDPEILGAIQTLCILIVRY
ncbi:MAG: hypothetical protein ALECFALPRED_004482 [Alectoria fallacina]|uniref:Uncharacterized protein n=1 Tax=Alectoria fallacina TaxID=1903189 RepID=A0A8H3FSA5_9LECA|nr:MAG: hypothetical protein ALECFALPRED_004482 [Alectoria fallacina]